MLLHSMEHYKIILFLNIIYIKILISKAQKCYSIYNCKKCPELDICQIYLKGYFLNKKKNKCIKNLFSLSNKIPILSRFKPSEKLFSKINTSINLQSLEKNINNSSINRNIDEVISYHKFYNIIKASNISSDYIKKKR